MNTMETICSRKTIRSFTGEPISEEDLAVILQAANASPVGLGKFETLHLTVITNRDVLHRIDRAGAELFGKPELHPLYGAPMLILISSEEPELGMENVAYSNAAMMAHNMALAATERKIGVCYIWGATRAVAKSDALLQELHLPKGFVPCCAVAVGKTDCNYELREIPEDKISKNFIR